MALSIGELVGYVRLDTSGLRAGEAQTRASMAGLGKGMSRSGIMAGKGWVQGADGKLRDGRGKFVSAGEQASAGLAQGVTAKRGLIAKAMDHAFGFLALGVAGKAVIGLEADFGKTMATIGVAVDGAGAHMDQMRALAMKMGADTQFSASDAADAMLNLGKAGVNASDIMGGALSGTMTLAAAGTTDLGTASTIAANAMNTFGLHGKDMASIADALAGGANASTASVESLGEALSQVGPGATNAGLSLQDTVGVLAAFDNAGVKGSDAGTSLKTMLTALAPVTKRATNALDQYGLMQYSAANASKMLSEMGLHAQAKSYDEVYAAVEKYMIQQGIATAGTQKLSNAVQAAMQDSGAMHSSFVNANGTFKSMTQVAGILQNKLGGLTQASRQQALSQIFGSDAARAATVLMKDGAKGIGTYIDATKKQGSAQRVAKANMSGTAGAIERMKGSIQTAGLALGQMLAPVTQKTAGAIGGLANAAGAAATFLTKHKAAAITLAVVVGGLSAVVMAFNAAQAVGAAGGMTQWLLKTNLIQAATKVWTAVQWALNAAMSANPIMLAVIAIVALVAALVIAWKKSDAFRNAVLGAWDAIKTGIGNAVKFILDFLRNHWPLIIAILAGPVGLAVYAIAKNWDKIKAGASNVVDWIKGIPGKIGALGANFGTAGRNLLQSFIDGMKNAAGVIKGIAGNVWSTVSGMLNAAIDKINSALEFSINKGPIHININPPDIPHVPGFATGGRVTGATLAMIGEGREPESVLPDSVLRGLLERVHAAGAASQQGSGRNAPLIGAVHQQPNQSPHELAENLWFLTRTRG